MKKTDEPIVVEEIYDVSIERVWGAITELEQMLKWYFNNIPAFEARVGFVTAFDIHNEGRLFRHHWEVTEVIPHKQLKYNWTFDGYEGGSFSNFELFEEGDKTRLKLSCVVLEDFPEDIPEFKRESCIGGWNYFLKDALKKYLDSAT